MYYIVKSLTSLDMTNESVIVFNVLS